MKVCPRNIGCEELMPVISFSDCGDSSVLGPRTDKTICSVPMSDLYTAQGIEEFRKWMTAPEGAVRLEGVNLHDITDLWPFDYNGRFADDYRNAVSAAAISGDRNQYSTSCRDGSESAEKVRSHDRFELPVFRQSSVIRSVYKIYAVFSNSKKNELPPFNVFGLQVLQRGGNSPNSLSLSFLSLDNASSTPCDQLANSCSLTISSRNSKRSYEIVTLRDFLLRFISPIQNQTLHKFLNICQVLLCSTKQCFVGLAKYETNQPISASYGQLVGISHYKTGTESGSGMKHIRNRICGVLSRPVGKICSRTQIFGNTSTRNIAAAHAQHFGIESVRGYRR